MRKRTLLTSLLLVLIVGCTTAPDRPSQLETQQAASAPAPDPHPAPAPAAVVPEPAPVVHIVPESPICASFPASEAGQVYREREKSIIVEGLPRLHGLRGDAAAAALQDVAKCLEIERRAGLDVLTVTLEVGERRFGRYGAFGILFWRDGEEWRAASLLMDSVTTNGYRVRLVQPRATGGYEAVLSADYDGTGFGGDFQLYALQSEMRLLWQSPGYGHFSGAVLAPELLLAHYRAPRVFNEPHFRAANCCLPTNGQTLWQRQGDTFVEKASRLHPSIEYTVSAFLGALSRGRPDLAANYVTSPGLVAAFQGVDVHFSDVPPEARKIDDAESRHWDAFPTELNGPAPTESEFIWPATPRPILLRRIEGDWKVAGWAN